MTYTYRVFTHTDGSKTIQRKEDNAFIPADEQNTDYQEYLLWVAEGNTPEEADQEKLNGWITSTYSRNSIRSYSS